MGLRRCDKISTYDNKVITVGEMSPTHVRNQKFPIEIFKFSLEMYEVSDSYQTCLMNTNNMEVIWKWFHEGCKMQMTKSVQDQPKV